ncbi:MAG TPA: site-2 protease family protein [Longimicrobiales bacterium]|nr:site-2 protease family protein [Longimicrobiales bacterium]
MGSFRLGAIFGFEIRIDFSWFIIFFLILWTFSDAVFPHQYPGLSTVAYYAMGTAGALLFFASLIAHELSHSLVARTKGIPVEGITLFIFGGMARTRMDAESPADEFQIAGIGPLTSLLLAGLFYLVHWIGTAAGWSTAVTGVAGYLALWNIALAIFNLLPGFPLDGGRVFRAIVWRITDDADKATRWASTGGKWLGYILVAWGVVSVFTGFLLNGLWLVFIGWFLRNAAEAGYQQFVMRAALGGVRAYHAMTRAPETVPPDLDLRSLVDDHFMRRRFHAFPVVDDGRPVGLVTLARVKDKPRDEWSRYSVRDVMRPLDDQIAVASTDPLTDVLEKINDTDTRRVLVIDDGQLVGIITGADIAGWLKRAKELG